jgi:hypothetical protein
VGDGLEAKEIAVFRNVQQEMRKALIGVELDAVGRICPSDHRVAAPAGEAMVDSARFADRARALEIELGRQVD